MLPDVPVFAVTSLYGWADAMSVKDGVVESGDRTPPDEEPPLYADGEWPCQTMVACGCAGLLDCPGPV